MYNLALNFFYSNGEDDGDLSGSRSSILSNRSLAAMKLGELTC